MVSFISPTVLCGPYIYVMITKLLCLIQKSVSFINFYKPFN
jgi:hypothetical protein